MLLDFVKIQIFRSDAFFDVQTHSLGKHSEASAAKVSSGVWPG